MLVRVLTLLLVASSVSASLFSIQSVESALENRTAYDDVQGNLHENHVSKQLGEMATVDRLEADYESGKICISQYLLCKTWRVFDPGKVPKEYALLSEETQLY